jgi:hypothetical protein
MVTDPWLVSVAPLTREITSPAPTIVSLPESPIVEPAAKLSRPLFSSRLAGALAPPSVSDPAALAPLSTTGLASAIVMQAFCAAVGTVPVDQLPGVVHAPPAAFFQLT